MKLLPSNPISSQMRAVNQFDRQGNWSDAIQILVHLPPPPLNITAAITGVPSVQVIPNDMLRVSGKVVLEWSPPDDPTEGGVTRYESWVGMAELNQFDNLMSDRNFFEVRVSTPVCVLQLSELHNH